MRFYKGDNLGPANSFMDLLYQSEDYEYYAFADQDDIWLENKLLRAADQLEGIKYPCLYASNQITVDSNGRQLEKRYSEAPPTDLANTMICNRLAGCTMVLNRKLRDILVRKDIAAVCSTKGKPKSGFPVDELISNPIRTDCMISFTNNDMYAALMAYIGCQYGRANDAYICYFDQDAPGDDNGAFHSCDLRYLFGRLEQSWRPYTKRDEEISCQLMDYFAAYVKTGNPNGDGRPDWQPCRNGKLHVLQITNEKTSMGKVSYPKLGMNMIRKGTPKA